ncbi:phage integrase family protein [Cytobacillus oceanisediminis]|jgi:integrase|uniref:Phage integrase family protein n=1 Tax=Cytobacillus oceanisediminis TaxID=665099 RepID=A0A2V2ZYN3_9BACI|nr:tyrosine-type recombinase/integrase [Cytobacillus oceanisediminis]PWW29599.1 phage integrase family protein [Cytobacillus oceanisediminis]
MKTVEAIKDIHKLEVMKKYLEHRSSRDYCLFLFGINTGVRIHDLLNLLVKDVFDENDHVLPFLNSAQYNNPPVYLNPNVRQSILNWIEEGSLLSDDYLFKSRKANAPITRQQAYRILNEAAKVAEIEGPVGTHTLRKTFALHAYRKGIAISLIQKRLQQSSPAETLAYLGISDRHSIPIVLDVNL